MLSWEHHVSFSLRPAGVIRRTKIEILIYYTQDSLVLSCKTKEIQNESPIHYTQQPHVLSHNIEVSKTKEKQKNKVTVYISQLGVEL